MEPEKILSHIDNQVIDRIQLGQRWEDILYYLDSNIKRYKKRDGFVDLSEKYIVNNWSRIGWKIRMTTMLVIQTDRRIKDIIWIKENHKKFPQYGSVKMYKLISLRDKLKCNKQC